jgi:hypothetical protein
MSLAPRIEDQYTEEKGITKNIFSVRMDSEGKDDYLQSSPEEQDNKRTLLTKNTFLDQQPDMDEQCRKDLPPSHQILKQNNSVKSVRFQ